MGGLGSQVINSWDPNALRAIGFDDSSIQCKLFMSCPSERQGFKRRQGWLNALIGGWQLSGLALLIFPASINSGSTWSTNWQLPEMRYQPARSLLKPP
jgi:hypothetical protein